MTESHDQFFPDDVDEQIKQFVQGQPPSSPDTQLIHDLYRFYADDTRIVYRVWERLSNRLSKQHRYTSPSPQPPLSPP